MLASLLLLTAAAADDCLSGLSVGDLDALLEQTEAAYISLDMTRFDELAAESSLRLPCLDATIQPRLAARYHRLEAIRRYLAGEKTAAGNALRAAWELEPEYVFPDDLLPPGHALRVQFEAMAAVGERSTRVPQPRDGDTLFNGLVTRDRPVDYAAIFQLVDDDAALLETRYLYPADPLPAYEVSFRRRNTWLAVGGGMLLGSGALYLAARSARADFDEYDPGYTSEDLALLRTRTNLLTGLSVTFALGAAGAGAMAFSGGGP